MRALIAALAAILRVAASACARDDQPVPPYAAQTATTCCSTSTPPRPTPAHRTPDPKDIRFGLYGALGHPLEADAVGGCRDVADLAVQPLSASSPDRLTGTACIGPQRDQAPGRGVYVYSPCDRFPGTTTAHPAAFPVGLLPTGDTDTGLTLQTTSVDAFRGDGAMLDPTALGDPAAFTGKGYMLLGLQIDGLATQYRDVSAQRGGPAMVLVSPTLPAPGLSHACDIYGSSALVLPDASRDAVQVRVSLCTQGEINAALLYPTVSLVGAHAGLWTRDD